jgi:hypothetical protein
MRPEASAGWDQVKDWSIRTATAAGVLLLAVIAFVLSYDALYAVAAQAGIRHPWLWPLVIDGFMVVASMSVLTHSRAGRSARETWYPWALVAGFALMSVFFNVAHAPGTPLAKIAFAMPPAALVLAFELMTRQGRLRRPVTTAAVVHPPAPAIDVEDLDDGAEAIAVDLGPFEPRLPELSGQAEPGSYTERARAILDQAAGPVSGAELARQLGCSESYGQRLLRRLSSTAGNGHA